MTNLVTLHKTIVHILANILFVTKELTSHLLSSSGRFRLDDVGLYRKAADATSSGTGVSISLFTAKAAQVHCDKLYCQTLSLSEYLLEHIIHTASKASQFVSVFSAM